MYQPAYPGYGGYPPPPPPTGYYAQPAAPAPVYTGIATMPPTTTMGPTAPRVFVDHKSRAESHAMIGMIGDIAATIVLLIVWIILLALELILAWYYIAGLLGLYVGSICISVLFFAFKSDNIRKIVMIIWFIWTSIRILGEFTLVSLFIAFNVSDGKEFHDPEQNGLIAWIVLLLLIYGYYGFVFYALCELTSQINKAIKGGPAATQFVTSLPPPGMSAEF